jgi:hypothetical protein
MLNKKKLHNRAIRDALIVFYTVVVFSFFGLFAEPYLDGSSGLRWAADSEFYLNVAKYGADYVDIEGTGLINTIGPVIISRLVGNSNLLITVFNYGLFLCSFMLMASIKNVDQAKMLVLMLANPMMLVSITTLSKEIIGFFVMSLVVNFLYKKTDQKMFLVFAILSMLVRWQMLFVIILFDLFKKIFVNKHWMMSRVSSVVILVAVISLSYPSLRNLGLAEGAEAWAKTDNTNFGTIAILNELQNNYLFFLSFIPKTLMNLVIIDPAVSSRITEGANSHGYIDVYNSWIVPLNTIMMIVAMFLSLKNSKFSLERDTYYLFIIYCIIFSLSPFIQPRYFFPLYAILCLESSRKTSWVKSESSQ